jgi:hypothetical protein
MSHENDDDPKQSPADAEIPCGIYRTTAPIEETVPEGALVFYHNHGDPGPGVYLPTEWKNNRAIFAEDGITVPEGAYAQSLEPLIPEGFYRVVEPFHCCEERCQFYEKDLLVQLGYNGDAEPILFLPEMIEGALALPTTGTIVDDWKLAKLKPLKVLVGEPPPTTPMN